MNIMATQKVEQYWRSLEAKIECPTCNKRLIAPVYMCGSGHSICDACTKKGTVCSQCRAPYTRIPNLLVQDLLLEFRNMKANLQELSDLKIKSAESASTIKKGMDLHKSVQATDEKYRCWITDTCNFTADISAIVQHFKNVHMNQFEEHSNGNLPYTKSWEMDYFIGKNLDHVIKIEELVFIIHISINGIGEVGACVLMYTSDAIAHQHLCQIEIICDEKKLCYRNAKVVGARAPAHVIFGFKRSGLQVARNRNMYNALREHSRFECRVLIQKRNETSVGVKGLKNETKKGIGNYRDFSKSVDNFEIINDSKQVTDKQQLNANPVKKNNRKFAKVDDVNKQSANLDSSAESDGSLSAISDRYNRERDGGAADCVLI